MQPAAKPTGARTCRACAHVLPYGTCACPAEAGLVDQHLPPAERRFSIAWADRSHAANCPAFTAKVAS